MSTAPMTAALAASSPRADLGQPHATSSPMIEAAGGIGAETAHFGGAEVSAQSILTPKPQPWPTGQPPMASSSEIETVAVAGPISAEDDAILTSSGAPTNLATDAQGNVFFVSGNGFAIGRIGPDGRMTLHAGTGRPGNSGDGGPATQAQFWAIRDMATDGAGNLYLSDPYDTAIRRVAPDGTISKIIGNGLPQTLATTTTSPVEFLYRFTSDPAGNLYIQNAFGGRVSRLSTGRVVSDFAGTATQGYSGDGGPATAAQLGDRVDLATDAAGNVYLADGFNHVIRKVSPDGIITTVAGTGQFGNAGDGGPAGLARLDGPSHPTVDAAGNLYFIDQDGYAIRRVTPQGIISTIARAGRSDPTDEVESPGTPGVNQILSLTTDVDGNLLFSQGREFAVKRILVTKPTEGIKAPVGFRITAETTSVIAGFLQTYTVRAVDADGNPVTNFTGRLVISTTESRMVGEGSIILVDGIGTFQAELSSAGSQRISLVSDVDPNLTGELVVTVSANQVAKFSLFILPGIAGRELNVSVSAEDVFGNRVLDYARPIHFFSSDPAAVLPADAPLVDGVGYFKIVLPNPGSRFVGVVDAADPTLAGGRTVSVSRDPDAVDPNPEDTFVRSLYLNVLGREGGDDEVGSWVAGLARGMTRQAVSSAFVRSIEHRVNQVSGYYWDYLNRAVDPASQFWVDALLAGASESSVIAGILSSQEYLSARQDDAWFIRDLYWDVLRRPADEEGLAGKTAALAAGASRASVVAGIVAAPEMIEVVLDGLYDSYLRRTRDPLSAVWEDVLSDPDGSSADVEEGILSSDEFFRVAGRITIRLPLIPN